MSNLFCGILSMEAAEMRKAADSKEIKMRTAIALLTLASFGSVFAVAQTPAAGSNDTAKSAKKGKKHHSKKKAGDATSTPATK